MRKAMIVKVFLGSLIGLVAAAVLGLAALALAAADGVFVMSGDDVVGIQPDAFGWSMLAVAAFSILMMGVASIGLFVAWIGAVLNTVNLADKTWFVVLLVGGLLSVGFLVTVAYVIAGPDGQVAVGPAAPPRTDVPQRQPDLAHH